MMKQAMDTTGIRFPVAGFAPGSYMGTCGTCSDPMEGVSKHATQCFACAVNTMHDKLDQVASAARDAADSTAHENVALSVQLERAEFDLLDQFAIAAIAGLCAAPDITDAAPKKMAVYSYDYADAMMVERTKRRQKVGAWGTVPNAEQDARELLDECAKVFRNYEALHRAKDTADGAAKAARNASMATKIEALLGRLGE